MAGKRGHGDGSPRYNPEKGYWEARFSYKDPATGESKRKMFTGKNQKEALNKGRKWVQEIENGLMPNADKLTTGDWIDRWLTDYVKQNVRVKSYDKYEGYLRLYVKPLLGNLPITKVKSPDVQRLFNDLLTNGGKDGKGLSSETVRVTRRYLIMCFDKAVKLGFLMKNVIKDTDPPKKVKKEIQPLNKVQAEQLTAVAKKFGEMPHVVILLALSTGMRLGEIFGLKWSDIDLNKGIIHVQRSVATSVKGQPFQEPKTAKSRRKIPVPASVVKDLRLYKKWQEWQQHLIGDTWEDNDLVITNKIGRTYDTGNFTNRIFKGLLKQAGIDSSFKFHDLRHTHATLLLLAGVNPKIVQERLGHSTITMTLDTYSHLLPDMQDSAVKALEEILNARI